MAKEAKSNKPTRGFMARCCRGWCCFFCLGSCSLLLAPLLLLLATKWGLYLAGVHLPAPRHLMPSPFDPASIAHLLPLAPASYPDAFQGIIWMDQGGFFAHSDVDAISAPDLVLSFGDTSFSTWDAASRTLSVDVLGPAWTWENNCFGYVLWWVMAHLRYFYLFEVNREETVIQVYPCLKVGGIFGDLCVPKFLMSFTMEKMTPPQGACPPAEGSTKKDKAKCAQWDRVSSGLFSWFAVGPLRDYGVVHYYVYQVVDGKGNAIQPYFDQYLKRANQACNPPTRPFLGLLGLPASASSACPGTFRGVRRAAGSREDAAEAAVEQEL